MAVASCVLLCLSHNSLLIPPLSPESDVLHYSVLSIRAWGEPGARAWAGHTGEQGWRWEALRGAGADTSTAQAWASHARSDSRAVCYDFPDIFQSWFSSSKTLHVSKGGKSIAGYTRHMHSCKPGCNFPLKPPDWGSRIRRTEVFSGLLCRKYSQSGQLHQQKVGEEGTAASMSARAIRHCNRAVVKL